jgi:prepilin signal peptidase PulO-like enzyme (type II secretory pathway)
VDVDELLASLPSEPNIRRAVLQNLRANAVEMGDYSSEGLLILQEIEAKKRHYTYALRGYDSYYRKKYSGFLPKLEAFGKLAWLHAGGLIWGHGEKPARLLLSGFLLLCTLTLVNFWSVMPRVGWAETGGGVKLFEYVIQVFLGMSPDARFQGYMAADYLIIIMRYVYVGLFISVLYKSISHR